ncbi:hypothetical protein JVT61DRAFT_2647 [Boletus reticuloceps]|uniref:CxC5 like cysteine cluster associated with KDZ domain-containing protein n=1 Tax=Boletus reticuloceps TaxID=495285 RepID=A0A8I2YPI9_9AGAM|nr:hypothetical protein JVT61DRAFT_2647 [Boletus reticuloceps]
MHTIHSLLTAIEHHPVVASLPFSTLLTFLRCAHRLKDDILQPQPHSISVLCAPEVLPPSITCFLAAFLDISIDDIAILWSVVSDIVWSLPTPEEADALEEDAFRRYGHPHGISSVLKKEEQHAVIAFTLADGAHPAWSVHLKCRLCHTNYHNNYSVQAGMRTYYPGVPPFVQVGEHQFVQRELVMQWMDLMQVAVSATNCAHLYDIAQARRLSSHDVDWQFGTTLTTEQVWDAFTILALLEDAHSRNARLVVSHDGHQQDCFSAAMHARTERIIVFGQDELPHACDGCMRIFTSPDGTMSRTEVVVTDGVTVCRPCCAIPYCKNPLASNRHRFCLLDPTHHARELICAVDGCERLVTTDGTTTSKSCDNPLHSKMETIHLDGLHSSKSRGQCQKLARLDDALATQPPVDRPDSYDGVEWFECHAHTDSVRVVQTVKASTGVLDLASSSSRSTGNGAEPAKIKAVFRRHRTNNEQLVVRPCGIINGRSTMYHHEAISNVLVWYPTMCWQLLLMRII